MLDFQTDLIFPTHAVALAGPLPSGAERLSMKSADGDDLSGIHLPPDHRTGKRGTLVLGFAGNAWNSQDAATYLHELFPDADVIAFHYRGYRPSSGSPSAEALIEDAPLVHDFAVGRVKPAKVVAVGLSIGSGIAAQLSTKRKLNGVILVTPFDSLKAVAQSMYPWVPIGPFFKHEIDAASAVTKSKVPVAIIAAAHDELIPQERTDALRSRTPNLVYDATIDRAGHNDLYARSDFHEAMREALDRITR